MILVHIFWNALTRLKENDQNWVTDELQIFPLWSSKIRAEMNLRESVGISHFKMDLEGKMIFKITFLHIYKINACLFLKTC